LGVPSGPRAGIAIADAPLLRVEPSAALHGAPPLEIAAHLADSAAFSGLGPLGMDDVTRLADRLVAEGLDLTAGPGGDGCDVGSAGAGSLDGAVGPAGAPCSGDAQLIFSPGRLTVSGAGRGVLVVDGDLELAPGAAFAGAILATGRLTLAPGASVTGAVRAREASIAGAIRFDACALARAFAEAPGLNRPLRPAGRAWVATSGPARRQKCPDAGTLFPARRPAFPAQAVGNKGPRRGHGSRIHHVALPARGVRRHGPTAAPRPEPRATRCRIGWPDTPASRSWSCSSSAVSWRAWPYRRSAGRSPGATSRTRGTR